MEDNLEDVNWLRVALYVSISGLIIFLGNHFYPDSKWFFPPSVVLIASFFFFMNVGKFILWKARYQSYQVLVNGCHGSIYGKPEYVSDPTMGDGFYWAIFNLGHSTFPVSLRGKLATLVVPANQVFPAGKSFIGLTLVQKTPIGSLPPPVHSYLRYNKESFNQDIIYYGKYSQAFRDNSSQMSDLDSQIRAKDILIGVLQKTIEHDFGNFEEIKEFASRMSGDRSFLQKMVSQVKKVKEDE